MGKKRGEQTPRCPELKMCKQKRSCFSTIQEKFVEGGVKKMFNCVQKKKP